MICHFAIDWNVSDDEIDLLQDPRHLEGALTRPSKQVGSKHQLSNTWSKCLTPGGGLNHRNWTQSRGWKVGKQLGRSMWRKHHLISGGLLGWGHKVVLVAQLYTYNCHWLTTKTFYFLTNPRDLWTFRHFIRRDMTWPKKYPPTHQNWTVFAILEQELVNMIPFKNICFPVGSAVTLETKSHYGPKRWKYHHCHSYHYHENPLITYHILFPFGSCHTLLLLQNLHFDNFWMIVSSYRSALSCGAMLPCSLGKKSIKHTWELSYVGAYPRP